MLAPSVVSVGREGVFSASGLVNNLHAERLRCLEEVRRFLVR